MSEIFMDPWHLLTESIRIMCQRSTQFQDAPGSGIFGRSVSWSYIPCLRHGDFRIFQTKRRSLKAFAAGTSRRLVEWRLWWLYGVVQAEARLWWFQKATGLQWLATPQPLLPTGKTENTIKTASCKRRQQENAKPWQGHLLTFSLEKRGSHVKLKHVVFLHDTSFSRFVVEPLAQSCSSMFFQVLLSTVLCAFSCWMIRHCLRPYIKLHAACPALSFSLMRALLHSSQFLPHSWSKMSTVTVCMMSLSVCPAVSIRTAGCLLFVCLFFAYMIHAAWICINQS